VCRNFYTPNFLFFT